MSLNAASRLDEGDPMRRLTVNAFVSLDGVMQALGAPEEDPSGGFTHGGWSVNYWDDEMMELMAGAAPYELLLGRGTYEIFAAHWPYVTGPIADRLNGTRKHVASSNDPRRAGAGRQPGLGDRRHDQQL
jgi:dihydrofolate reductase